jgi:CMP/dCMP kinase
MLITIDGPIATGKSTIAKHLAHKIGYIYYDTGAMYRCVTYAILKRKIHLEDAQELTTFLEELNFEIKVKNHERRYYVDAEDVTEQIRGDEVTSHVSKVSAIKSVREKMVALQREHSIGINAVFEGRDMGTVVFPHADVKIFLTGDNRIRAKRRFDELKARFPEETKDLTIEKVLEDLIRRDTYDSTREISPLKRADDALVIDTTDLSVEEIVSKILEHRDSIKTKPKF